jgi:hypothetical protein
MYAEVFMGQIVINVPQRVKKEYDLSDRAAAKQIIEFLELEGLDAEQNPISEEDARDICDAQRSLAHAKRHGVILWEDLKVRLGI